MRVSPPTEFSVSGKKIVRDLAGFFGKKIVLKLFDNRELQKNHPQSFVYVPADLVPDKKKKNFFFPHEKQTKRKKKVLSCSSRFFFPLSSVSFINPDARQSPTKEKKKKKTPDVPFYLFLCVTQRKKKKKEIKKK